MPLTSARPDTARAAKSLPLAILNIAGRVLVALIAFVGIWTVRTPGA